MDEKNAYPVPGIKQAHASTVFLMDVNVAMTLAVVVWGASAVGQKYYVWIKGYFGLASDKFEQRLVYNDRLTKSDIDKGVLEVSVPRSDYEELRNQVGFFVVFGVNFEGNTEGQATIFPSGGFIWVRDSYLDKTNFNAGDMSGWMVGAEVDPADVTLVTHVGKPCLHYRAQSNLSRKTIIYKEFDLVKDRRYYFTVSIAGAAGVKPQMAADISLAEGNRFATVTALNGEAGVFYIEGGGVTARSSRLRLDVAADGGSAQLTRGFYITDIALYEFDGKRTWNPEWDVEWGADEHPPAKDPQVNF